MSPENVLRKPFDRFDMSRRHPIRSGLAILAPALFSMGSALPPAFAGAVLLPASVALLQSLRPSTANGTQPLSRRVYLLQGLIILVASLLGPTTVNSGRLLRLTVTVVGGCLLALAWYRRTRRAALCLAPLLFLVLGAVVLKSNQHPPIDVWELHQAAAHAFTTGDNPYADLRVRDTNPFLSEIRYWSGYPYPPLTLLVYGGSAAIFGESRIGGILLAVLASAGLSALAWNRSRGAAFAAIGFALIPGSALVMSQGFTEPLPVFLFVLAALLARRSATMAALTEGLALGSKQYFVVVAPLFLRRTSSNWRGAVPLLVGLSFALAPLAFLSDWWFATVAVFGTVGPRPDSLGLPGMVAALGGRWLIPTGVVFAVGLIVSVLVRHRIPSEGPRSLGAGATLAVVFCLNSQAFVNYWYLVAGLLYVSLCSPDSGPSLE